MVWQNRHGVSHACKARLRHNKISLYENINFCICLGLCYYIICLLLRSLVSNIQCTFYFKKNNRKTRIAIAILVLLGFVTCATQILLKRMLPAFHLYKFILYYFRIINRISVRYEHKNIKEPSIFAISLLYYYYYVSLTQIPSFLVCL